MRQSNTLERVAKERNSRVDEVLYIPLLQASTTGHVKPCGKMGGPPPKAKYYPVTDSGIVP